MENKRTIILTGGSGFLGSRLLKLISDEYNIILIKSGKNIEYTSNNITSIGLEEMSKIQNAHIIIHCAGVIRGTKQAILESNVDFTNKLIEYSLANDLYFIFISSLNVKFKYKNNYVISKYICEQNIMNSLNKYTIIRPAYLFDDEFEPNLQFINPFIKYLKYSPILIKFNCSPILQPLNVLDLICYIIKVLDNEKKYLNKIIEIAGACKVSMSILINSYIKFLIGPRKVLTIPNFIEKIIVFIFSNVFNYNYEDRILTDNIQKQKYVITCKRKQKFIENASSIYV